MLEKIFQLYELDANLTRIEDYFKRWLSWFYSMGFRDKNNIKYSMFVASSLDLQNFN